MSLRLQLLAFGALTLVLPWAGWRYVHEMEATLRAGFEQSLLASAGTVAAALGERLAAVEPAGAAAAPGTTLYAPALASAPAIDGFRDDWNLTDDRARRLAGGHRFWVGVFGANAYLYVAVHDADRVYPGSPGRAPYGDRLLLSVRPAGAPRRWLVVATRAPGALRAQQTRAPAFVPSGVFEDNVIGEWRETADGYVVELRLPLALVGSALGIGVIDVRHDGKGFSVTTSTSWPAGASGPGPFRHPDETLQQFVHSFGRGGDRYRVLDQRGWVLADVGGVVLGNDSVEAPAGGLAGDFFRFALNRRDPPYRGLEEPLGRVADTNLLQSLAGRPVTAWYRSGPRRDAIVAAAVPIRRGGRVLGAVLLERASDPILTVTNRALLRLMSFTLLASLVAALGLLGFATLLSLRVRRLARAAETALGPKGEIHAAVPGRRAHDELGDLARSFAALLGRLRDYTAYLRSLTSKLSHELRTPVAIVTTSLDNLRHEVTEPAADVYMQRLKEGAERLAAILSAMSEATRIEQAIGETKVVTFDLGAVLEASCRAYTDVYRRPVAYRSDAGDALIDGSPDLIAQMMDKLIDNAVSFSDPGTPIDVSLTAEGSSLTLDVVNRGSSLPATMRGQLFDSLVSIRERNDGRAHLGLGLYIVSLIVEFHRGRIQAQNLADGSGVVFRIELPRRG